MAGGKWSVVLPIMFLALAAAAQGRSVPNEVKGTTGLNDQKSVPNEVKGTGLNDQKNLVSFGGVGGYSGIGSNGLPVGGFGVGGGVVGDLGGTGPNPTLGGIGGGVPFGGVVGTTAPLGGLGGGGVTGAGTGLGNGGFPFP